jgi:hypothetical protein
MDVITNESVLSIILKYTTINPNNSFAQYLLGYYYKTNNNKKSLFW